MLQHHTILVTGGAGFIGAHVARRLGEMGQEIIIVDNFNPYYDPRLKEARVQELLARTPHTLYRVSIEDVEAMRDIFKKHHIDLICHQAAQAGVRYATQAPLVYGASNVMGTLTILELAREFGIKGIVMASSSSVYGNALSYPVKETDVVDKPISVYGATKRACELMCWSYHHLYRIPITYLRYFTVYGPWGRPDMAFFLFTKAAIEGKVIDVFGQGEMMRDFTYIDDIVDGIVKAFDTQLPWAVVNLAKGKAESLMRMIELIEQATGKTLKKRFLEMQLGDVRQTWADVSLAKELLEWKPATALEQGIPKFVEWYKGYYGT